MQYSCINIHYLNWINSNRQLLDMQRWKPRKPHAQLAGMGEEQQQEGSRKPQEALRMALWGLWLMVLHHLLSFTQSPI